MKKLNLSYNSITNKFILDGDIHREEVNSIDTILTPYRKDGKTYKGLVDELISVMGDDIVIDATETSSDVFEKICDAFSDTSVKVVGVTNVYIEYEDTPRTSITIQYPHMGSNFHTPDDSRLRIEDWVHPIPVLDWNGIYKELENEIGTDNFTVYFRGDRKYMKLLLSSPEIDGMNVDVFFDSTYETKRKLPEDDLTLDVNVEDDDKFDNLANPTSINSDDLSGFATTRSSSILGWNEDEQRTAIDNRYKSTRQALGNITIPQGKWNKIEDGINHKDIPNDYTIVSTQLALVENINRLESLKNSWIQDSCKPKDPKYNDSHIKKEMKNRRGRFGIYLGRFEKCRNKKKQIIGGVVGYVVLIILLYILSRALVNVGDGGLSIALMTIATVLGTSGSTVIGIGFSLGFWYIIYSSFRHHYRPQDYDDGVQRREEVIRDLENEYRKVLPTYNKLVDDYESKKAECIKKIDEKLMENKTKLKALESKFPVVPKNYRDPQSLSYIANVLETNRVNVSGAIHMYQEELTRIAEEEAYDRMARAAESEARSRRRREAIKDGAQVVSELSIARSAKKIAKAQERKYR